MDQITSTFATTMFTARESELTPSFANDSSFPATAGAMIEQREPAALPAATNERDRAVFLAGLIHEIRAPLTAILGYADLLLDDPSIESALGERVEYLRIIQRNGNHLRDLANDIVDLSRIEAGQFAVERIDVPIVALVEEIINDLRPLAEQRGLQLVLEYQGSIPETVETDPTRVRQLLLNLLSNAIKFTSRGSVILRVARAEQDGRELLRFQVADTGIGLSAEQLGRLFRPFAQAERSTARLFGGTGLGLALCKQLVELLGGTIMVQSQPALGSVFTATIAAHSMACAQAKGLVEPRPFPQTS